MIEVFADKSGYSVPIGRRGENETRVVVFDVVSEWRNQLGDGTVELLVRRQDDSLPYPAVVVLDGNTARWTVKAADVYVPGTGEMQLNYIIGDRVAKSKQYRTFTENSMGAGATEPPETSWIEEALKAGTSAQDGAARAEAAAGNADKSEQAARTSADNAAQSERNAQVSAGSAAGDRSLAEQARIAADAALNAARQAADASAGSAVAAGKSAESAEASSTSANKSAETATGAAGEAISAASSASQFSQAANAAADRAESAAGAAQSSQSAAARSEAAADKSAEAAGASQSAAAGSAESAKADAESASGSAGEAAQSAQNAANSAASAGQSAISAGEQAQAAAGSSATATNQATKATEEADRAKTEADNAAGAVEAGLTGVKNDITRLSLEKADKEGEWELIETYVGNGKALIKDTEPDGTPYNFSKIELRFSNLVATNYIFYVKNEIGIRAGYAYISGAKPYNYCKFYSENGLSESEWGAGSLNDTGYGVKNMGGPLYGKKKTRHFTALESSKEIETGLKIEIWAVRAK